MSDTGNNDGEEKLFIIHLCETFDKESLPDDSHKLTIPDFAKRPNKLALILDSGKRRFDLNWTKEFREKIGLNITRPLVLDCAKMAMNRGYRVELVEDE